MRKIVYVTGTRADFGLLESTLKQAAGEPELNLSVCVTGMHLSQNYGYTVREVEKSGLRLCGTIPVDLEETSGASMAKAVGSGIIGMVDVFNREKPDLVLVLGDRGEQLAGALAAIHLNIPVAHIHGGERSGTVDEPVRHAISKLSHYHFVATEGSRERLIRMGEREESIFVAGAPGLDGLKELARISRKQLCEPHRLDPDKPLALVLLHPVLQEAGLGDQHARQMMDAVLECNLQAVTFLPNADAGGNHIREALETYRDRPEVRLLVHMPRKEFVSWMAQADVIIGNSSSGIIEAATFGTPVVNIGNRQNGRERSGNVQDASHEADNIVKAIQSSLNGGRVSVKNVYGDGLAGKRIVDLLKTLPLTPLVLQKFNTY